MATNLSADQSADPTPSQTAEPPSPTPLFDMSKAQPIQATDPASGGGKPLFDMSKAQPIAGTQSQDEPSLLSQAGGAAKDVLSGVGGSVFETVQGAKNLVNKALPNSMQIPDVPTALRDERNTGEKVGGFAEGVGEFALGGEAADALKGLSWLHKLAATSPKTIQLINQYPKVAKILISAAKEAGIGAVQGGVKGAADNDAAGGAEAGAEGGTIGGAFSEVAPAVVRKLGEHLEKYAPDFVNSMLRAKKGNFLYGKNPGQAIIDEKLTVPRSLSLTGQLENLHGQLETAGNRLDSAVKQILNDPAAAKNLQNVVPLIQKAISDAKNDIVSQSGIDAPKFLKALNELETNILTKYDVNGSAVGTLKNSMTPAEVSDLKKSIGKTTQWKISPLDPDIQLKGYVNSVRKAIYGQLADTVENASKEPIAVKHLNERFANVIEAQGLLENRIAQEHGSGGFAAAVRKGEWASALGGLLSGHPYLGASLLANRVSRSVPGRVLESQAADAAGSALQSPVVSKVAQSTKNVVSNAAEDWIKFMGSDGKTYLSDPEHWKEVQRRDPGARPIQ